MHSFKRRHFLQLAGASLAMVANGKIGFAEEVANAEREQIRNAIADSQAAKLPNFSGTFVYDHSICRGMATDFGHFIHKMPLGVLFPASYKDVQKAICFANNSGVKIAVRGTGGAAYGQTQVEKGIVINTSSLCFIRWVGSHMIDVGPGALWKDVVDFSMKQNLAPPVLPDTLYISVGGTLNAGGIGETSYRLGAQVDHVVEIDVVTGEGDFRTCSLKQNTELFNMVLAGMGQCGVIVRARIRLFPAVAQVTSRRFFYHNRTAFLADLAMLAKAENSGAIAGDFKLRSDGITWNHEINITSFGTAEPSWLNQVQGVLDQIPLHRTYSEYLNRNTQGYLNGAANGTFFVPHAYLAFFLPQQETLPMVNFLLDNQGASLGAVQIAIFPMITKNFSQALQMMPEAEMSFHLRIYRKATQEGSASHLQMLALNQNEFVPRIFSTGGKVYLPFSPLLSNQQRIHQFGSEIWKRFSNAKAEFDPNNVLNPGAGLFS